MTETIEFKSDDILTQALELDNRMSSTMNAIFQNQLEFDRLSDAGTLLQKVFSYVDVNKDLPARDQEMLADALKLTIPEYKAVLASGNENFAETLAEGIKNIFVGIYKTFLTVFKRLLEAMNILRAKGIGGIRQASYNQGRSAIDMARMISEEMGDPRILESKEKDIKSIFKTMHRDRLKKQTTDFFDDYRHIVNLRLELMEQLTGDNLAKHMTAEKDRLENGTRLEALGDLESIEMVERVHNRLNREIEDANDRIRALDRFVVTLRKMSEHKDIPVLIEQMYDYVSIIDRQIKERQRDKYGWVINSLTGVSFTPFQREGDIYMVHPRMVKGDVRRQKLAPISLIDYISFVRDERRHTTAWLLDNRAVVGKTKVLSSSMKELNAESMTIRYVMMQDLANQETTSDDLRQSIEMMKDFIKKIHIASAEEMKFLIQLREFYVSYNTAFLDYPVWP